MTSGRLSQDATYDDVGYFIDSLQRVHLFHRQGIAALLSDLVHNPPHSPFSTGFAVIGFLAFGEHDWAPYTLNLALVIGSLYLLASPFRKSGGALAFVALAALASVPLLQVAIVEFRPDFAVGLATAAFCAALIPTDPKRQPSWGWAGVLLGVALLTKPPFLPHTILLAGWACAASLMVRNGIRPLSRAWWTTDTMRGILRFWSIGIIIALPYYACNRAHIVEYFLTNTFSGHHASLWRVDGGYWGAVRYFTTQAPVADQLGFWFWGFLGTVTAGVVAAVCRREQTFLASVAPILGAAALSLGVLVLGRHANQFFGVTFQLLLATAACRTLARWAWPTAKPDDSGNGSQPPRKLIRSGLVTCGFAAAAAWQLGATPPAVWFEPSPEARPPLDINTRILDAVAPHGTAPSATPPQVFLATAGSISAPTLEWLALKAQRSALFFDAHRAFDIGEMLDYARSADFVVVATEDQAPYMAGLPSNRMQTALRAMLLSEGFGLRERFQTSGPPIDLLVAPHRDESPREDLSAASVSGASGFLPPEGPYPQWRLGRVQWGLYPQSTLPIPGTGTRHLSLHFSVRCESGQHIEGRIGGRIVGEHKQTHTGFETAIWTFDVAPDENTLSLVYAQNGGGGGEIPRTALFRQLQFETLAP